VKGEFISGGVPGPKGEKGDRGQQGTPGQTSDESECKGDKGKYSCSYFVERRLYSYVHKFIS